MNYRCLETGLQKCDCKVTNKYAQKEIKEGKNAPMRKRLCTRRTTPRTNVKIG